MKNLLSILLITLTLNSFAQEKVTWHTDMEKAVNLSIQSEKPLFLFFTGSDWCGWCKKLVSEVFNKQEFKKWANQNVIVVEFEESCCSF